jgi:hypothetical protein
VNAARPRAPLGPTGLAARAGGHSYVIIKTNHKPQRVGPVQASTLGPVLVTAPNWLNGHSIPSATTAGPVHPASATH